MTCMIENIKMAEKLSINKKKAKSMAKSMGV